MIVWILRMRIFWNTLYLRTIITQDKVVPFNGSRSPLLRWVEQFQTLSWMQSSMISEKVLLPRKVANLEAEIWKGTVDYHFKEYRIEIESGITNSWKSVPVNPMYCVFTLLRDKITKLPKQPYLDLGYYYIGCRLFIKITTFNSIATSWIKFYVLFLLKSMVEPNYQPLSICPSVYLVNVRASCWEHASTRSTVIYHWLL